jgi:hypothetical protein
MGTNLWPIVVVAVAYQISDSKPNPLRVNTSALMSYPDPYSQVFSASKSSPGSVWVAYIRRSRAASRVLVSLQKNQNRSKSDPSQVFYLWVLSSTHEF